MEMENNTGGRLPYCVSEYKVYEDYLDSKVTQVDLVYLKVSVAGSNYLL